MRDWRGGENMYNSQKYFLIVAEELNICRAAKKIFISQQCLSNHIKRLEESYGLKLFQRKPRLVLTEAGKRLARTLRQIQILENTLENDLSEIGGENKGLLRVGMHSSRAGTILPLILPKYRSLYPQVELSIYSNVGREMEQMLFQGQLDLFVANHPAPADGTSSILLMDEQVYLVISDNILQEYFPNKYPQCKQDFKKGIDIADFREVPFITAMESSNLRLFIDEYFISRGIRPRTAIQTNITEMHYQFSSLDYGASFCPSMMLSLMHSRIKSANLNIFPLRDYAQRNRVVLEYLKGTEFPRYIQDFIDLVVDLCRNVNTDNIL
jgi:DNA-binding transcriptional LysR family regulator